MRTHTCGEITTPLKTATLCGWVNAIRSHGAVLFVDIRDRHGITQVVLDKKLQQAVNLGREYVIQVKGSVQKRKAGPNPELSTGAIELVAEELKIISEAEALPMEIDESVQSTDDTRLKYRYIDLRKQGMQNNFLVRHNVIAAMREYANNQGFLEIDTPMLVKSTPEGARDYIVPSRVNEGKYYALPQSPQLYKQILMISGFDRYYQVAKCLRDEDLRQDRQPEHSQFDYEMSFVTQEQICEFTQGLFKHVFHKVLGLKLGEFPILTYDDSMNKYGTDKPDLRFGLELMDVTSVVKNSGFGVFKDAACVKCINPEKEYSRKAVDKYTELCKKTGAKGLVHIKVGEEGLDGGVVKFLDKKVREEILKLTNAKPGSSLFFVADEWKKTCKVLGMLRNEIGKDLGIIQKGFKFCFVNDFPLFSWNEDEKKWEPEHHMFSMPKAEFVDDFENRPGEVKGDLWDVVLNGVEIGSGSIRVSEPKLQERIMKFIGFSHDEAMKKFGFLLEAYKYGAPVHGGMGLGVDRFVALMLGHNDIREVIAFPKNKNAECPMDGSPSPISDEQMKELHLK